jgi:hypothetical protein
MTAIAFKASSQTSLSYRSEKYFSGRINSVKAFESQRHKIKLKQIFAGLISGQHYSYIYNSSPLKHPITLRRMDNQLIVKFSTFNPRNFENMFNLSLADIVKEVNSISTDFYNNNISILQYNLLLSVWANRLRTTMKIRFENEVSVDLGDHVYGGPVHLTMDISNLTQGNLRALTKLISITDLSG